MPFRINYGNPYGPAAGAATFEHAREETDFARSMANNQVKLQERSLELQDAQLVLNGNLAQAAEARAKRAADRLEEQDAQQAEQWRAEHQRRLAADREGQRRYDLTESRLIRQFDATESRIEDQFEATEKRLGTQQTEAREEAKRAEQNELQASGGRLLREGGKLKQGDEYAYRDAAGQIWAVPTASKQRLDESMRRTVQQLELEGPGAAQKERNARLQTNLSAAVRNAIALREQAVQRVVKLDKEATGERAVVERLTARGDKINTGERRTLAAAQSKLSAIEAQKAELGIEGKERQAEALSFYQMVFAQAPAVADVIPPEQLSMVDWAALNPRELMAVRALFYQAASRDRAVAGNAAVLWNHVRSRYPK